MAKLTAEQQRALDDLTALANAPDADDDEVWVENSDGHKTKLTGARAAAWLKRNGYDDEDGDQAAADADAKSGAADTAQPVAKKTAPKKTAPVKAGDQADDEDQAVADVQPAGGKRAFF